MCQLCLFLNNPLLLDTHLPQLLPPLAQAPVRAGDQWKRAHTVRLRWSISCKSQKHWQIPKKKKHDNAVSKANQQIHSEFKSGHLRSNTNAEHGPPWPSPQACSPWAIASLGLEGLSFSVQDLHCLISKSPGSNKAKQEWDQVRTGEGKLLTGFEWFQCCWRHRRLTWPETSITSNLKPRCHPNQWHISDAHLLSTAKAAAICPHGRWPAMQSP